MIGLLPHAYPTKTSCTLSFSHMRWWQRQGLSSCFEGKEKKCKGNGKGNKRKAAVEGEDQRPVQTPEKVPKKRKCDDPKYQKQPDQEVAEEDETGCRSGSNEPKQGKGGKKQPVNNGSGLKRRQQIHQQVQDEQEDQPEEIEGEQNEDENIEEEQREEESQEEEPPRKVKKPKGADKARLSNFEMLFFRNGRW